MKSHQNGKNAFCGLFLTAEKEESKEKISIIFVIMGEGFMLMCVFKGVFGEKSTKKKSLDSELTFLHHPFGIKLVEFK